MSDSRVMRGYEYAREVFGSMGIDTDVAIKLADAVPVSMHSWQGDDLVGFDGIGELSGGIASTGNYPGRATTADELRTDIDMALSMIPGGKRLNLHACHGELAGHSVDRDRYSLQLFERWVDWAKQRALGLDFNPTFFSHPRMDGNFSLSSRNPAVRSFWIEHGKRCREIGAEFGRILGSPCIVNFWMPDGYKDVPADTVTSRRLMIESLDEVFSTKPDGLREKVALESKLFGLGVESYTVVSHEFALGYAQSRGIMYTLDSGHFHPTETVSGKLSATLQFLEEILLHLSRGVRWDSDHVVTWTDELQDIMTEIVSNGFTDRVHIGMDYFDASINRIACWVIGMRNARKALLRAALTPVRDIRGAEDAADYTSRLALIEETKSLPFAPVWDYYCLARDVPLGGEWLNEVKRYEREVLSRR